MLHIWRIHVIFDAKELGYTIWEDYRIEAVVIAKDESTAIQKAIPPGVQDTKPITTEAYKIGDAAPDVAEGVVYMNAKLGM